MKHLYDYLLSSGERARWLRAFWHDPELKAWVIGEVEGRNSHYVEFTRIMSDLLEAMQSREESNWEEISEELAALRILEYPSVWFAYKSR